MSNQVVNVEVEAKKFASDYIKSEFYGGNMVFDHDSFDGLFPEKVASLGVTSIRYPGGGAAERSFDLLEPNDSPLARNGDFNSLEEFLDYAAENGHRPIIVIPTKVWKYQGIETGEKILSKFIEDLTSGVYGDATNAVIEIGNEYYNDFSDAIYYTGSHEGLTAIEYGEIASKFLKVIEESASHDLEIAVQIGKHEDDNTKILSFFNTPTEKSAIDFLVYHNYFWTEDSVEGRTEKYTNFVNEWRDAGIDAKVFVSEWNVGSTNKKDKIPLHDYGLSQVSAMIEFVSEASKAGVDMATVWAVQNNNKTSLSKAEGSSNQPMTFAGYIFGVMTEHLIGSRVLNIPNDKPANGEATIHAFESATEVIVFLSANDFDEENGNLAFDIDLNGFGSGFTNVTATELSSTHHKPTSHRGTPITTDYVPEIVTQGDRNLIHIEIGGDHRTVILILEKETPDDRGPVYLHGDDTNETLVGSALDDSIYGNDGDDFIHGGSGNDELVGGRGNDTIRDFAGNDKIYAGDGNDDVFVFSGNNLIYGGDGNDVLIGGIQSDKLFGGNGDDLIKGDAGAGAFGGADTIRGGSGNDIVEGGQGADIFVFGTNDGVNVVASFDTTGTETSDSTGPYATNLGQDFTIGLDHILLDNFSSVNSSNVMDFIADSENGTVFSAEGTVITIYGVDSSSLSSDDFLFL